MSANDPMVNHKGMKWNKKRNTCLNKVKREHPNCDWWQPWRPDRRRMTTLTGLAVVLRQLCRNCQNWTGLLFNTKFLKIRSLPGSLIQFNFLQKWQLFHARVRWKIWIYTSKLIKVGSKYSSWFQLATRQIAGRLRNRLLGQNKPGC